MTGFAGLTINGIDADDNSGTSVSGAGDVNGDGIDDLIIGADAADPGGDSGAGETYVVFGVDGAAGETFPATLDLATLNGTNGFVLEGIDPGDASGFSVSGAGDVNGDGIDDLIVGAFNADPGGDSNAGETYVVFGVDGAAGEAFPATFD
ncbi:MAG: integrin alpha, partial [Acidobacteriota bacterium]